jgi:hypothetical protein
VSFSFLGSEDTEVQSFKKVRIWSRYYNDKIVFASSMA